MDDNAGNAFSDKINSTFKQVIVCIYNDDMLKNCGFFQDVVKEAMKTQYSNPTKTKISSESVEVMSGILKILVTECALRACNDSKRNDQDVVKLENVENILTSIVGSFLLDFLSKFILIHCRCWISHNT